MHARCDCRPLEGGGTRCRRLRVRSGSGRRLHRSQRRLGDGRGGWSSRSSRRSRRRGVGNRLDHRVGSNRRHRLWAWGRLNRVRRDGREQAEGVDVSVGIGGEADAEVDVRRGRDRIGALTDHADDSALRDGAATQDARRCELQQRYRIAVRGLDRDGAAAAGDRADERDRARRRGEHSASNPGADVDAAMLPACIGVRAERERPQHRSLDRPHPGVRRGGGCKRREQDQDQQYSPHDDRLR